MTSNDPTGIDSQTADRIERLLRSTAFQPLIRRLDRRLGKRADLEGRLTISDVPMETVDAVNGLLGRPPSQSDRLTIRLSDLDAAIRSATGVDLATALTVLLGRPPLDPPSRRREDQQRWEQSRRQWLSLWTDTPPDVLQLLEVCPGTADLRRLAADEIDFAFELLDQLRRCLLRLPLPSPVPLPIFAAETIGDSHGLDVGRPLHRLLCEAIDRLHGKTLGDENTRTRDVFARVGVLLDELASTVLVLNLRPCRGNLLADFLNESAILGEPARLTFRQLRLNPIDFNDQQFPVSVCENPSILATAADALANRCGPMICVEGFPSHAALLLIDQINDHRKPMRYHGDFDASGLQIAHQMIVGKQMAPWRMNATDYQSAVARSAIMLPTNQPIIETPWDPHLQTCLRSHSKSVIEELVVNDLLEDLSASSD